MLQVAATGEEEEEEVDWIHVDQDRDQWIALVNTVMNVLVPHNVEKLLSS
jgi:hypothetical protein